MGGGVGWVLVQPAAPMGCHCLRGRALDATKYIERTRGNESQIKTVRFWESFLKRDENAMIHAELNWKGDTGTVFRLDGINV